MPRPNPHPKTQFACPLAGEYMYKSCSVIGSLFRIDALGSGVNLEAVHPSSKREEVVEHTPPQTSPGTQVMMTPRGYRKRTLRAQSAPGTSGISSQFRAPARNSPPGEASLRSAASSTTDIAFWIDWVVTFAVVVVALASPGSCSRGAASADSGARTGSTSERQRVRVEPLNARSGSEFSIFADLPPGRGKEEDPGQVPPSPARAVPFSQV